MAAGDDGAAWTQARGTFVDCRPPLAEDRSPGVTEDVKLFDAADREKARNALLIAVVSGANGPMQDAAADVTIWLAKDAGRWVIRHVKASVRDAKPPG